MDIYIYIFFVQYRYAFAASPDRFLLCLQFKESVAQFAQENIAPHASKIDKANSFPKVVQCSYW